MRGDSGFATPEVYDTCESYKIYYVVRLKVKAKLAKLAESFVLIDDHHPGNNRRFIIIPPPIKPKAGQNHGVCIKSTREAGELVFHHEYSSYEPIRKLIR